MPPTARRDAGRRRSLLVLAGSCALFGSLALLWPGDAPFINDEPRLLQLALEGASHGMESYRGVVYGPVAVWFYRALLFLTHDLAALVLCRAALFTLACGGAIVWTAASCPALFPPAGALALVSTYYWLYARLLWDNSLLIPLSWLTTAAYLSFGRDRRPWKLGLVALGCAGMLLTHLMSAPVVGAILLHLSWRHGGWLKARPAAAGAAAALFVGVCAPYFVGLARGAALQPPPKDVALWRGWVYPWLGGKLFSAYGLEYFFGADRPRPLWARAAETLSLVSIPLLWLGLADAARRFRARTAASFDGDADLASLGLIALFFQSVLYGALKVHGHPHYYAPLWPFCFYFVWRAVSLGPRWLAWGALQASLALTLASAMRDVHLEGGNKGIHYGPTIANQVDLARRLDAYHPDSPLSTRTTHYALFPHSLATIQRLYGLHGDPSGPVRRLAIVYRDPASRDGAVELAVSPLK